MSVHVCASLPMPILWLKAPIAVPVTLTGRGEGKKKYTSTRRIWRIWRVWRICAGISNTLATCCVGIGNTLAATRRIRSRLCWKALAEVSESFPDATEGKTMFFLSSPKILTISPPPLGARGRRRVTDVMAEELLPGTQICCSILALFPWRHWGENSAFSAGRLTNLFKDFYSFITTDEMCVYPCQSRVSRESQPQVTVGKATSKY